MGDQKQTSTDDEVIARRDEALRRALMTPPKPHQPKTDAEQQRLRVMRRKKDASSQK